MDDAWSDLRSAIDDLTDLLDDLDTVNSEELIDEINEKVTNLQGFM